MRIGGYQPLSLLDYPGAVCSIVFTQGCPFRCAYCHNPDLISPASKNVIDPETVFDHLEKHKNMLEAVCITGGEPTIQPGLRQFIERIKSMGFLVKLDTNGVHPVLLQELIDAKLLDYIAMDLKNVWERYQDVVRAGGTAIVDQCKEAFKIIQDSDVSHEFRTTICPGVHNEKDFIEMAGYLKPGETYIIQETRFNKVLDENLPQKIQFSVENLVLLLESTYPKLNLHHR